MSTCKTCKWWKPVNTFEKSLFGVHAGSCTNTLIKPSYGEVPINGMNYFGEGDSDMPFSGNHTGSSFGCIHWEGK